MLIPCPLCGPRDLREFIIRGAALPARPSPDSGADAWDSYLHLRDNPAGLTEEFWHHKHGCTAWLVVQRCTLTHRISAAWLAGRAPALPPGKGPAQGREPDHQAGTPQALPSGQAPQTTDGNEAQS